MVPLPGWPLLALAATPPTLIVSQLGGGDFTELQEALDAAPDGTRIEIHDGGTFTVSLEISDPVTIVGVGARPTLTAAVVGADDGVVRVDAEHEEVRFENLRFDGAGGSRAMRVHRGLVDIVDCAFEDHQEFGSGGTIVSDPRESTEITLLDSVFTTSSAGVNGGFVSMPDGSLTVTGCTFTGGSADSGGAIHMGGSGFLTVTSSTFVDNTATVDGGAIHSLGTTNVSDSRFTGNEAADDGGAIAQDGASAVFTRLVACDNEATESGGALFLAGTSATVLNSVFVRNASGSGAEGGGAIRAEDGAVTVSHASMAANSGDPGQAMSGSATLEILDTYVGHHTTSAAVTADGIGEASIDFSGLSDNADHLDLNVTDGGNNQRNNALIPLPAAGSCNPLDLAPPAGSDLIGNASDGSDIGALDGANTWPDADSDGFLSLDDCNDADPLVHPGAIEIPGDGVDQDCDGGELCYQDADGDGFGDPDAPIASVDVDCTDTGEFETATDVCAGFDDAEDDDGDLVPNGCDDCPNDPGPSDDDEDDGVCDSVDVCPGFDDTLDTDGDGTPNGCDDCSEGDSDGDGVGDDCDLCPGFDDREDRDSDGNPDGCDACPDDDPNDSDSDDVCDSDDTCPGFDDRLDRDGDGIADACDDCEGYSGEDTDGDGVCDLDDPCPDDAPDDADGDGVCGSDAVDGPRDADGVVAPAAIGCGCGAIRGGGWLALFTVWAGARRRTAPRGT